MISWNIVSCWKYFKLNINFLNNVKYSPSETTTYTTNKPQNE